jgi:hypothetical protein
MGELSAFFGRHVGPSLLGALGIILAALGFAEQADTIVTRFEPWQLQAVGALFFVIFVVKVLISYDGEHVARGLGQDGASAQIPKAHISSPSVEVAAGDPELVVDPTILPADVAREYLDLLMARPTELQKRRMLLPYNGKWMLLTLTLGSIARRNSKLRAFVRHKAGDQQSEFIVAYFDLVWEDHLHNLATGTLIRFKGRVSVGEEGDPEFIDCTPL